MTTRTMCLQRMFVFKERARLCATNRDRARLMKGQDKPLKLGATTEVLAVWEERKQKDVV